jgi:hypothetical protein
VILALVLAPPLAAHDHWIAPSSFHPSPLERVDLHLRLGHPAGFEEQLRDPRRFARFESVAPDGAVRPLLGLDGRAPAALLRPREPGLHWAVFQSLPATIEIDPAKYAAYLESEGLEEVQRERERRGELELPGRDRYARFDKALLRVGDGPAAGFERVVGLPFELALETDPAAWVIGSELRFRLLLAGAPLAERQVKLARLESPYLVLLARTDGEGRVRFEPPMPGAWCAFSVHQRRAAGEAAREAEWEGSWASLALELGGP